MRCGVLYCLWGSLLSVERKALLISWDLYEKGQLSFSLFLFLSLSLALSHLLSLSVSCLLSLSLSFSLCLVFFAFSSPRNRSTDVVCVIVRWCDAQQGSQCIVSKLGIACQWEMLKWRVQPVHPRVTACLCGTNYSVYSSLKYVG